MYLCANDLIGMVIILETSVLLNAHLPERYLQTTRSENND